jgi:hypothetical protein
MLFAHKCHGGAIRAFRFGVHKTPSWFFEALEKGTIKRCSGVVSAAVASIQNVETLLGSRLIYNEDWVVHDEISGLFASVTQDDFQNNFERINDPTDPPIQSNVDEAVTNVSNAANLAVDLDTVSNLIAKEFARLESENAELRQRAENNNTCYISEAAWAERVGKYLCDKPRNGYSMLSRCVMVYIPDEAYETLMTDYKALGHSVTSEEKS